MPDYCRGVYFKNQVGYVSIAGFSDGFKYLGNIRCWFGLDAHHFTPGSW
jgi:hypothetical protein